MVLIVAVVIALVSPGEVVWYPGFTSVCAEKQAKILDEGLVLAEYVQGAPARRLDPVATLPHVVQGGKLKISPVRIAPCAREYVVMSRRSRAPVFRFKVSPTEDDTEIHFSLNLKIPACGG